MVADNCCDDETDECCISWDDEDTTKKSTAYATNVATPSTVAVR